MGNPIKSKDKLRFKIYKKKYSTYLDNDTQQIARIIINGIKTHTFVRSDGAMFTSYQLKSGHLKRMNPTRLKSTGYEMVPISINNKVYRKLVHRLVAAAFIPNPDKKPEVNHIDGVKHNNDISNLEWVTEKENMHHAIRTKLLVFAKGEDVSSAKITEKDAEKICKLLEKNKLTMREIADKIGCSKSIVANIKKGQAWTFISDKYDISKYSVRESINNGRRLDASVVEKICKRLAKGDESIADIARRFKMPYSRINDIKQRKTWSGVSYKYDFSKCKNGKYK